MAHAGAVRLVSSGFTIVHISLIVVRQLQAALGDLSMVWIRVGTTQDKVRSLEKGSEREQTSSGTCKSFKGASLASPTLFEDDTGLC